MGSPLLWGPNNTASNLQNQILQANGTLLNYSGPKNYITYNNFENNATTGWSVAHTGLSGVLPTAVNIAGNALVNAQYLFTCTAANATVGATYTNNAQTFTVVTTIAAGTLLVCTGTGAPAASGTLTKSAGTGDSTITFASVIGTSVIGNMTFTTVSNNQLAGNYSGSLACSSAFSTGDMLLSQAYTIDKEDQAKVLTFKFYYNANTGAASMNFSGTSSNTFAVWIYDVTNAQWVMPAGVYGMVQGTGSGYVTGTFQTASNASQYQLAIVNINTISSTYALYVDDFFLGPQTAPMGPAVGDWSNQYSLTYSAGFGTTSNSSVYSRRVGDSLQVYGTVTLGTAAASVAYIQLPAGLVMDTSKLPSGAGGQNVGLASTAISSSADIFGSNNLGQILFYDGSTNNQIFFAAKVASNTLTKQNGNAWYTSSGGTMTFQFSVPIAGWSSNSVQSADTDTRVVDLNAQSSGSQALTSNTTNIAFATVLKDSHGAFSSPTYTIPVAGDYVLTVGAMEPNSGTTAFAVFAYVNGTIYTNGPLAISEGGNNRGGTQLITGLKAGDTLTVRSNTSLTIATGAWLNIFRLSGPAVVTATESVNARYYASATSISGSLATISWTTKDYDSHNAMSSGTYTCPVSGKYQIQSSLALSGTFALNNISTMEIQKNGTVVSRVKNYAAAAVTQTPLEIGDEISCLAGDTLRIQVSSAATSPAIVSSNFENYVSIFRTGN